MKAMSPVRIVFAVLLIGLFCCGCSGLFPSTAAPPSSTDKTAFPPLDASQEVAPGVRMHEVTLQREGVPMKVYIYLPDNAAPSLPCVLIGPAGSHMIDGMKVTKEDRDEHLPYVRAGFAVVTFDIDGAWPPGGMPRPQQQIIAARAYKASRAGLLNASTALDFALARVPSIDKQRIYVAGHSSAATLALLIASTDPRIKACAAFAPVTDVNKNLGANLVRQLNDEIDGYAAFVTASSPASHLADLKCPLFLFHASDDNVVPVALTRVFVANLKRTNPNITFVEVPRGGHHDSMINEGIPQAIKWFQKLAN